jgi:hypothetical protein
MARASSSSSCTEMDKSSLRRVLRLNHLGDMHGSNAGVCASLVDSLCAQSLRPGRTVVLELGEIGAGHVKGCTQLDSGKSDVNTSVQ